jgi:NUMOD3 motif
MKYYYTYKINFIDGFYYFGSRESGVTPDEDVYWGSPKTHKDKWSTTMFSKIILNSFNNVEEMLDEENKLIRPVYKTDPFCLNENCGGRVNFSPEIKRKMIKNHKGTKGKKHTEESKQKMSAAKKGHTYNKGRKHTEESKRRMSEAMKGKKCREGTKHSAETKQKLGRITKNTIWINDGNIRKRIPSTDPIPVGFVRGRILNTYVGNNITHL